MRKKTKRKYVKRKIDKTLLDVQLKQIEGLIAKANGYLTCGDSDDAEIALYEAFAAVREMRAK